MVSDKSQVRSVGPVNQLHRQPVKVGLDLFEIVVFDVWVFYIDIKIHFWVLLFKL